MKRAYSFILCCGFLAAWLWFPAPTASAKNKAEIADVQVNHEGEILLVGFRIENCFNPDMEEAIRSGMSTTFRIRVVLDKTGFSLLPLRSPILDMVLERTIRYDRLRQEFIVQIPEFSERIYTTSDFEEAKNLMTTVRGLPVIPLWRLQKDQTYQLRLKAELSKFQLPAFLRYIFFFVTMWDFESDWQRVNFSL